MIDNYVADEKLLIKKRTIKDLADYINIRSGQTPNYSLFLGAQHLIKPLNGYQKNTLIGMIKTMSIHLYSKENSTYLHSADASLNSKSIRSYLPLVMHILLNYLKPDTLTLFSQQTLMI